MFPSGARSRHRVVRGRAGVEASTRIGLQQNLIVGTSSLVTTLTSVTKSEHGQRNMTSVIICYLSLVPLLA